MVLYNVTVNVSPDIETDWLLWMKKTHIPEVLSTKRFYDHRFLKMLSEHPDAEGNTYAIQYMAQNMGELDAYLTDDAQYYVRSSLICLVRNVWLFELY